MKRGLLIAILIAVLALVAACGGGSEAPAAATEAPASQQQVPAAQQEAPAASQDAPAATATPLPPTATPVPPTAESEAEEEALSEEQLAALEALDSYRLVVTYRSQGVDSGGNAIDDSAEIVTEYTKDPQARRMVVSFTDNIDASADSGSMETFQIGEDMYMFAGEDVGWMRISTEESPFNDPDLAMMTSAGIFSDLEEMRRVRPDQEINGIDSRHYQFDEKVLGRIFGEDMGDVTANGDLWIAKDGGFVTKYLLTIEVSEGNGGILDPNLVNGTLEMSFELKDVNSDIVIELPEDATAGASLAGFDGQPFPMPEGSRVQAASANFTIVESDQPAAEVIAFYEQALAELGWTQDTEGSMSFGNMASLAFTKDGVQLSLLINTDDSTGKVQIMANAE